MLRCLIIDYQIGNQWQIRFGRSQRRLRTEITSHHPKFSIIFYMKKYKIRNIWAENLRNMNVQHGIIAYSQRSPVSWIQCTYIFSLVLPILPIIYLVSRYVNLYYFFEYLINFKSKKINFKLEFKFKYNSRLFYFDITTNQWFNILFRNFSLNIPN